MIHFDESRLDPFLVEWIRAHRLDTIEGAFAFRDGELLAKPGLGRRARIRIEVSDGKSRSWELYLKRYEARPMHERLLCRLTGRGGDCVALREYETIAALRAGNVPTMRNIACGVEIGHLGVGRSFVLVSAVPGDALERIGEEFLTRHIKDGELIEVMTARLVELVRGLHGLGLVHRDLYASHIFLYEHEGRIDLNLIDLARVFRPCRWRQRRWQVKDLAQLKYSMPWLWVERYWTLFLMGYLDTEVPDDLVPWNQAIDRKVRKIQQHDQNRQKRKQQSQAGPGRKRKKHRR
jgi:tRNA A-37 threonylcarbamoyl transferase component Bud32